MAHAKTKALVESLRSEIERLKAVKPEVVTKVVTKEVPKEVIKWKERKVPVEVVKTKTVTKEVPVEKVVHQVIRVPTPDLSQVSKEEILVVAERLKK